MEAKSLDEDAAATVAWEKSTSGEPLGGMLGIPVRWQSKYAVALRWVVNGNITVTERAGQQRSFTMKVERLGMRTSTQYAVTGRTDDDQEATVLFDLKYRSNQNGAGIVIAWPAEPPNDTNVT